MTDLLRRPDARDAAPRSSGGPKDWFGLASGGGDGAGRPLPVGAAIAGVGAVLTGLVTCMALAVVGWFLADAGAHGQTTDALRVGADVWLVGHGSRLSASGVPLGIVPLTLTLALAASTWRLGRWAAATSAPPEDDATVAVSGAVFSGLYVVLAVVVCLVAGTDGASPGLGRTVLGALLLSGVAGTLGMAAATGHLRAWVERVPGFVRAVALGAVASTLLLVAAASVLVAGALVLGLNEAATLLSALHLGAGDYVMYAVATLAVAPNAVLLGVAYLLGPGFAVGTGTVVSPSVVAVGPVPAFPLLAAIPDSGPTPAWTIGFLAVPVLAAMGGAVLAQKRYAVTAYDSAALRGFGGGFGAAVLVTVLVALAGGPMGTGRMADIGGSFGAVLVAAVASMSLGGLVAGVATAWWQRRGQAPTDRVRA